MSTVLVTVRRGTKILETVERPLRDAFGGPAVKYKRRLWRLKNGEIDLDCQPLDDEPEIGPVTEEPRPAPEPQIDDTSIRQGIVSASATARQLVEAGPGTGKTELAARRLAELVCGELNPAQILVLSFSRSAVRTLTRRVSQLNDVEPRVMEDLRHLSIRTFDSWAFRMLRLLGEEPRVLLSCSHDANIAALTRLSSGSRRDDVRRFIGDRRHIIVDEFQDLPGVRGDLVLSLLSLMAPPGQNGCGFTILGDPAQAIFGFACGARDDGTPFPSSREYWDQIRNLYGEGLTQTSLVRNYRADPPLARLASGMRSVILGDRPDREKLEVMLSTIAALPEPQQPLGRSFVEDGPGGSRAILTQTNGEAIRVLQALYGKDASAPVVPVRLNAGNHAPLPPAWIGALLRKVRSTSLPRSQFGRIHAHLSAAWEMDLCRQLGLPPEDHAWGRLAVASGAAEDASAIDIAALRERLAWPDSFPDDQAVAEDGIIVTTVHQSKGMEFDTVTLLEPEQRANGRDGGDEDPGERASVAYVSISRAARALNRAPHGQIHRPLVHWTFADERRRLCCEQKNWLNVEMGLRGDIEPLSFADPAFLGGADGVEDLQAFLLANAGRLCGHKVMLCKQLVDSHALWHIHLQDGSQPGRLLGRTTNQLSRDLLRILHKRGYSLPTRIMNLRISSVGTVSADGAGRLGEPEKSSGLWLGVGLFGTGDFQLWKAKE